jgi:hypothetical protein
MVWIVHRLARWISKYPKTSLGLVVAYVGVSVFELFPVEFLTDFIVVLSYLLLLGYVKKKREKGEPLT